MYEAGSGVWSFVNGGVRGTVAGMSRRTKFTYSKYGELASTNRE